MTIPEEDYRLSFSQREGKAPLPEPMRLDYLPTDFRNQVWRVMDSMISRQSETKGPYRHYTARSIMRRIISEYTLSILHQPHDSMQHNPDNHRILLRGKILEGKCHEVLSLIEFILKYGGFEDLNKDLRLAFWNVPIAYTIQTINGLPTIVPRYSEESGAATDQAIKVIEDKGLAGAKAHLRKAADAINQKQYADAIRESIHTVESVARRITPDTRALKPALDSLERKGVLKHPALKTAFDKLYGYTSDEEGIRHSLLSQEKADVDLDDAIFMFAACAAFAAYLINRSEQMTKDGETS